MCFATISQWKKIGLNANVQNNSQKKIVLLYYINMTTNNRINCKWPRVLIMYFYRLVRFHTQIVYCARLSVGVSNSGHPVMYARKFCNKRPVPKYTAACQHAPHEIICFFIILQFYIQRNILHNYVTWARKYRPRKKFHILHWYTYAWLTCYT